MPRLRWNCAAILFSVVLFGGSFLLASSLEAQQASKLTVTISPQGNAAKDRPLSAGGSALLKITVRNETKDSAGPVTLRAVFPNQKADAQPELVVEGDALGGEIAKIEAGASVERNVRVRIVRAPFPAAKSEVTIEARVGEQAAGSAKASLLIADCIGTYREKLGVLRAGILQEVRDAADAMRRADPSLPAGRAFPMTNARKGDVLNAERLAAPLSARGAADAQMSTEWMRFTISRWVSELTSFSNQPSNAGMCANNYYQIAGYREGLQPITKRLEAFRNSSEQALAAARTTANIDGTANPHAIVLKIADAAGVQGVDPNANVFALLGAVRGALARGAKLEPQQMEALSLAETAAWLGETDKRGQALNGAIEKVLSTIGSVHKESCVCAF